MKKKEAFSSDELFEFEELVVVKSKSKVRLLLENVCYILFTVLVAVLLIVFVVQRTDVSGHSMESTLSDKDCLLVDKLSYRFREPKRFEIVVFRYLHKENTHYIKRVIGLPGETVQIKEGKIFIDGELLEEEYGLEPMKDPGLAKDPITLKEGEYFLLGDNRNHSTDSRSGDVAAVKKEQLVGRALVRIWPLKKIGWIPGGAP